MLFGIAQRAGPDLRDRIGVGGRGCVLTINGGSSSIRFAVHQAGQTLRRRLEGSATSSDVRDLLAREATDVRAAEAVALGGVDTLVFAGGIGEHAPLIRQICNLGSSGKA